MLSLASLSRCFASFAQLRGCRRNSTAVVPLSPRTSPLHTFAGRRGSRDSACITRTLCLCRSVTVSEGGQLQRLWRGRQPTVWAFLLVHFINNLLCSSPFPCPAHRHRLDVHFLEVFRVVVSADSKCGVCDCFQHQLCSIIRQGHLNYTETI